MSNLPTGRYNGRVQHIDLTKDSVSITFSVRAAGRSGTITVELPRTDYDGSKENDAMHFLSMKYGIENTGSFAANYEDSGGVWAEFFDEEVLNRGALMESYRLWEGKP